MNGIVIVDKPAGWTSQDVTARLRRVFNTRRIGHGGTLDPMATGVLPVFVGRATRGVEFFEHAEKTDEATLRLGITTDTEDTSGNILTKCDTLPTKAEFFEACKRFEGDIKQIPPMYSALKVNGKKLCDLARSGETVDREARSIHISGIIPEEVDEKSGIYRLYVDCSKGTYIRTLCADIGAKLGCGAAMSALFRTKSGNFSIDSSHTIAQLENMTYEERCALLMPTENLFDDCSKVVLPDFYTRLAKSGCEIYQAKIKTDYPLGEFVTMWDKNGFFALGQVKQYEGGTAIKAGKLFVL